LSLQSLLYAGVPFRVPSGDDWPALGFLTPEEVIAARRQYDNLSLTGMTPAIARTIEQMGSWLRIAADRGHGLVGIHDQ